MSGDVQKAQDADVPAHFLHGLPGEAPGRRGGARLPLHALLTYGHMPHLPEEDRPALWRRAATSGQLPGGQSERYCEQAAGVG